jgi:hypothetical protein
MAIEAVDPQLIIPCDDRAVLHLHELYTYSDRLGDAGRNIKALIARSLGPPESYPVVGTRYELLKVAREAGLPVPPTHLVRTATDLHSWRNRFPWVLKADGTFGGRGVKIVDNLEQAELALTELSGMFSLTRGLKRLVVNRDPFWLRPWWHGLRPSIIAQSYVRGFPANCAVVCWEGKVLAGIGVDVISTAGLTDPATVVRVVHRPEMMHAAEALASRLRLSGFFGLDFMIEESTGIAHLIEMNPRSTPLSHLHFGKGRDLVGALSAQLSSRPLQETPPITLNEIIAYFPQSCGCSKELLANAFLDVPWGEPELIRELLSPWPGRSRLFQVIMKLDRPAQAIRMLFSKVSSTPPDWSAENACSPRKYDAP